MKQIGIVRNLDKLGRIVIPREMLNTLQIGAGDSMEIHLCNRSVIITPAKQICTCCGNEANLIQVDGTSLCAECVSKFVKANKGI